MSQRETSFKRFTIQATTATALLWGLAWLVWRIGFSRDGTNLILFSAVLALEVYAWVRLALLAVVSWRVPEPDSPQVHSVVAVDVFVTTYHETTELVRATLLGASRITYPHTTYLLDDSNRDEMRQLAEELGVRYEYRTHPEHARAGLINYGLIHSEGDLVLLLNADQVPMPDTLHALVGHFSDPKIAFVQTPIEYANRDSVLHSHEDSHERSLHNQVIAPARHAKGAAIWEGSASLVRRSALLAIGGLSTETTTYDLATSMALHANGWKGAFHPEVVVQGQAPHNLQAFLTQRDRWARGELAIAFSSRNPLIFRGLTLRQRLVYIQPMVDQLSGLYRFAQFILLTFVLLSAELPFHASAAQLIAGFGVWFLLSSESYHRLGRGHIRRRDLFHRDLLTMQAMLGALVSVFIPGGRRFRPVENTGVDRGGFGVIDRLKLLTALTALLEIALILRMADALLGRPLNPQTGLALVVMIAVALLMLRGSLNVLGVFVRR
ncbi:MAG: glycosyltransferase, partial [Acidimicrobiales bacterium]